MHEICTAIHTVRPAEVVIVAVGFPPRSAVSLVELDGAPLPKTAINPDLYVFEAGSESDLHVVSLRVAFTPDSDPDCTASVEVIGRRAIEIEKPIAGVVTEVSLRFEVTA